MKIKFVKKVEDIFNFERDIVFWQKIFAVLSRLLNEFSAMGSWSQNVKNIQISVKFSIFHKFKFKLNSFDNFYTF